jgi:hypothetical protein
MANWDVRVTVGESGLNLGPSVGVNGEFAEKGPVVEVVVVTGEDSVSEALSFGRLSLRRRLRTRADFDRLCGGLSVILSARRKGGTEVSPWRD